MAVNVSVIEGNELQKRVPATVKVHGDPGTVEVAYQGKNGFGGADSFILTEKMMSHHLLVVGGIGSGKTNTLQVTMHQITESMTDNDVMIVFDTKGDFKEEFYRPGTDVIISNDRHACGPGLDALGKPVEDYWNLVSELEDDERLPENVIEICNSLYAEKLRKTNDSFFPNAAKELAGAILFHAVKKRTAGLNVSNYFLKKCFSNDLDWLHNLLDQYEELKGLKSYIPTDAPKQAEAVITEMRQVTNQILIGNFAKKGTMSIRNLVRQKQGRRIFIEYDIGVGSMLTPIYSLLFDLAIKEALCREHTEGNVYLICDEFKLLPNLLHIDDAVNFGRSLGIKFMIGIQNVDQIIDIYGEHRAKNIFSGFMNHYCFLVSDFNTRNYIKERAGKNRKMSRSDTDGRETIEQANVIEDWDVSGLMPGEAMVMLHKTLPFRFTFEEYETYKRRIK